MRRSLTAGIDVKLINAENIILPESDEEILPLEASSEIIEKIKESAEYIYTGAGSKGLPVKLTASEITHGADKKNMFKSRPAFMHSRGMTPAERGTALHELCSMQILRKQLKIQRPKLNE